MASGLSPGSGVPGGCGVWSVSGVGVAGRGPARRWMGAVPHRGRQSAFTCVFLSITHLSVPSCSLIALEDHTRNACLYTSYPDFYFALCVSLPVP